MAREDEKKPTAAEKGKDKVINRDAEDKKSTKADGKDKKVETTGGMFRLRRRYGGKLYWMHTDDDYNRRAQRGRSATEERT